jgi:hypothetical protein
MYYEAGIQQGDRRDREAAEDAKLLPNICNGYKKISDSRKPYE